MNYENMLAHTSIARGLRSDQLGVLARSARWRSFEVGASILTRHDTEFPLMVVLDGEAEVRGMFGQDVSPLKVGDLIGEIGFLDRGLRTADVVATSAVHVAVFPEDLLEGLSRDHPDVAATIVLNISLTLCSKLRWAQRLIDAGDAANPSPDR